MDKEQRRRQIERHDVAIAQCPLHHPLGRQLIIPSPQADQGIATLLAYNFTKVPNLGFLKCSCDAFQNALIDQLGTTFPAYLQGRIGRVEVGGGIKEAERNDTKYQQILPEGILV
jgi:hypothetical protein